MEELLMSLYSSQINNLALFYVISLNLDVLSILLVFDTAEEELHFVVFFPANVCPHNPFEGLDLPGL